MKKIRFFVVSIMLIILASCSSDYINVNYSDMPKSFELGSELPDFSRYISINKGEEVLDVASLISSNINMGVVGDYLVNIDISELDPINDKDSIQIEVSIVDSTPPSIIYVGQFLTVNFGYELNTELITCEDLSGCEITYEDFGYQSAGKNQGRVTATDTYGNVVVEEIEFTVIDNTSPTIEIFETRLRTSEGYAIRLGSEFELPPITISDKEDPNPIIEIESNVRTDELGVYKVSIFATDSYGNKTLGYLNYHVVENLQLNFVNHSIEDIKEVNEGFLILANSYNRDNPNPSGNPLFNTNSVEDLDKWNGQTLSLVNNNYELIWTVAISSEHIRNVIGVRGGTSEGIFLFGSSSREQNSLSNCRNNSSTGQSVGTILKYDINGELQARSLDFGKNCSSTYTDLTVLNNRVYVESEVYIDGSENYASLFSLVILDSSLNELSNILYENNSFFGYKTFGNYSAGMPIFNNSLWILEDSKKVLEIDFNGNEVSNGLFDIRYEDSIEAQLYQTRVITSFRNICSSSGQRWNNTAINSNGSFLATFFNVVIGPIEQGACRQDAILVIYDEQSTHLSSLISELDQRVEGNSIVNLGFRDKSTGSPLLIFTDREILEIKEDFTLDIYDYNAKVDQISDYYNSFTYQIVLVRDSMNPELLFSSLVMRDSLGRSSVLFLN